ncbi:hypothetical protein BO94DRAFT_425393, partial [Aspergillus sclerotioniger CBS 115572]
TLSCLPSELLLIVASYLPNRDIKNLRLTARFLHDTVRLRLDRVFLSANPLNISVFRAIADDERFRQGVVEIIWDDAVLVETRSEADFSLWGLWSPLSPRMFEDHPEEQCPVWFAKACRSNLKRLFHHKHNDVDGPDHMARALQVVAAQRALIYFWEYYQRLLIGQKWVIETAADTDALIYGINQFPALKRVTVTPAAHGWLFAPLYETPMILSFPYGFNYPIPRGWPTTNEGLSLNVPSWASLSNHRKDQWRGFRITTRVLAQQRENHVTEFILHTNQLYTGLNCRIFEESCEEYDNLICLLRQPGFSRLDLALITDQQEDLDWYSFYNGRLRYALAQATQMRHISLTGNMKNHVVYANDSYNEDDNDTTSHLIPIRTIFPIEKWTNLQHFELSSFVITKDDMVSFLAALPKTICSIKLRRLNFFKKSDHWPGLLIDIRDKLHWRERDIKSRPKLTIIIDKVLATPPWWAIWIEDEVSKFLYENGPNPF